MPKFELDAVTATPDADPVSGYQRGRTAADAVCRALALEETAGVEVIGEEEADLKGWRAVTIEGRPAGAVRAHQRMQFRRD